MLTRRNNCILCTYVGNVHIRIEGQEQLDNICMSFSCRPTQSGLTLFALDINIEVMNKGLHLGKITRFGSCMKCVIIKKALHDLEQTIRHTDNFLIKEKKNIKKFMVEVVDLSR